MARNTRPTNRFARLTGIATPDTTTEQAHIAEEITLQRVDEAAAVARPENISGTWLEDEYTELETEQSPLWDASGIETSRPAEVEAAGLLPAATASERIATGHIPVLEAAAGRYSDTVDALTPFRRRPSGGKLLHYAAKSGLLLGDMIGVTMMGINIGDYPVLAFLMSISAATAAVISGLVGSEVRDLRSSQRRRRDIDSLTDKQKPFQHLFTGVDEGAKIVKVLCGLSAGVALTIAAAIFAGRAELEGALTGLIYGGIAAAVAAASLIESYMYADEIADQLDTANASYEKELARHQRLAGSVARQTKLSKDAEAESIRREHALMGKAAAAKIRALKWGILRRNAGVVGHGAGVPATGPVGRTARDGSAT